MIGGQKTGKAILVYSQKFARFVAQSGTQVAGSLTSAAGQLGKLFQTGPSKVGQEEEDASALVEQITHAELNNQEVVGIISLETRLTVTPAILKAINILNAVWSLFSWGRRSDSRAKSYRSGNAVKHLGR